VRAGVIDEVRIHLVPVLLGSGTRLLDAAGDHIHLEPTGVITVLQRREAQRARLAVGLVHLHTECSTEEHDSSVEIPVRQRGVHIHVPQPRATPRPAQSRRAGR